MKEEVRIVYQVVKYRLCDGDSDVIRVGKTYRDDYAAVEAILSFLSIYKDDEVEVFDYEDSDEELTWLFDESIYVKKIASYYGENGFIYRFGVYVIELQ